MAPGRVQVWRVSLVALAWVAIVATSSSAWEVESRAEGPAFTLPAGETRTFYVTLRPSQSLIRAGEGNWLSMQLAVATQGVVVGTSQHVTLRVSLAEEGGTAADPSVNGRVALARSRDCASRSCVPSYRVMVSWPEAPAGSVAAVSWSLEALVSGPGDSTPSGGRIELDVAPVSVP
jgi:hypothetical protein